ncbi:hypothetical protein [Candidatus Methylocalor cossyra]|uniref:hypothetical protein n=1 Tax=Candidatus Methylocalor cossyra TaxID=3108543 RepID=UPI0032B1751C
MSRTVVLMLSLVLIFGFSCTKAGDTTQQDYAQQTCLAITTDDPSYRAAVARVASMPMVKEWIALLDSQSRMALGGRTLDKTEFIEGNCYWSISLYESNSIQLRLWKIFRVDIKRKNILIMNDEGDYVLISPSTQSK